MNIFQTLRTKLQPPFVVCFTGLVCMFCARWLTSRYVFEIYDSYAPWLRDIAVVCSCVVLGAITAISIWKPRLLTPQILIGLCGGTLALGSVLVLWWLNGGPNIAVVLGACFADIGSGLICLAVCIACLKLELPGVAACLGSSFFVAYLIRFLLAGFDAFTGFAVYCMVMLLGLCVISVTVVGVFGTLPKTESPAETAITRPHSFIPLTHKMFIALLVFEIVYGYAITMGSLGSISSDGIWQTAMVLCAFILLAGMGFVEHVYKKTDWLFIISVLAILTGILALGIPGEQTKSQGSAFLTIGSGYFQVMAYFVLISLGIRNKAIGITALSWGSALMSLGVVIGANLSKLVSAWDLGAVTPQVATAAAVFVLVAVALIVQHGISLETVVTKVEDATVAIVPPESSDALIETRCLQLSEASGLTARETEVLMLLARGRNSPAIQEKLNISYNTARTHVRHIYEKCGFHTQQELIDAIEHYS